MGRFLRKDGLFFAWIAQFILIIMVCFPSFLLVRGEGSKNAKNEADYDS
jgi:hypothetical protein